MTSRISRSNLEKTWPTRALHAARLSFDRLSIRRPMGEALGAELARLDYVAARAWQALSALGLVGSVLLALFVAPPLGLGAGLAALAFLLWFSAAASRLQRAPANTSLVVGTTVVEALAPWAFEALLCGLEGPAYALGSWVPPMIFCGLIIASTLRLKPLPPLAQGVSGALLLLTLYFGWIRGALSDDEAAQVLHQPGLQLSRAITLLAAGVGGAAITLALRRALERAEGVARQKDLFGKYRLLRAVASGGMGSVHEALYCPEGGFERRVAVKRIHPHLAGQPAFVEAFRAEAELGAHLSHPNVVGVLDFGRIDDAYFLAMDYVEGASLQALFARTFSRGILFPEDVVAYIAREMVAGLVYAHEVARGPDRKPLSVVHRDLCPHNVMISFEGEVKITDFGIARALGEAPEQPTQNLRGHVAYIAPEQLKGRPLTRSCDIYATGVILWEMLAGAWLFKKDSEAATLTSVIANKVPSVKALRPDIDPRWDALLAGIVTQEPAARYASARALGDALEQMGGGRWEKGAERLSAFAREVMALPVKPAVALDEAETVIRAERGA